MGHKKSIVLILKSGGMGTTADQVRCCVVGGMTDIITAMWRADTVIDL